MNKTQKYSLSIFVLTLLPNILAFFPSIFQSKNAIFDPNKTNNIALFLVLFSILGPLYILFNNNRGTDRSKGWNIAAIILLLIILFYAYLGYSVSNINF